MSKRRSKNTDTKKLRRSSRSADPDTRVTQTRRNGSRWLVGGVVVVAALNFLYRATDNEALDDRDGPPTGAAADSGTTVARNAEPQLGLIRRRRRAAVRCDDRARPGRDCERNESTQPGNRRLAV